MEIIKEKNKVYILNDAGKEIAYVTFPFVDDQTVCVDHTYVDDSLRGMGIASKLMEACYEVITENNYHVILKCSYAISWFDKHNKKI